MNKQKILVVILTSTLLTGVLCYNFYQSIYGEFITKDCVVFIGSIDTVNDIQKTITMIICVLNYLINLFMACQKLI